MAKKDFHHPFEPYDIQQQLMESIYDCIEQGKVGIFESPTGTGKSLSLICGSLTWLREHKRRMFDEALATIELDPGEPDWIAEHARDVRARQIRGMRIELEERLAAARDRERKIKERAERAADGEPAFKRQKQSKDQTEEDEDEDEFVLDDYASDNEGSRPETQTFSAETTKLMEKLGLLRANKDTRLDDDDSNELKVFFCSRTHSQLSQFIGELQRVKLPPGLPPEAEIPKGDEAIEELKHLTLGSRENLCINPKVNKLVSQTAVNERCVELQQSKTPANQKCQFLPSKENADSTLDFRDHALSRIRDIEDMAKLGSRVQICPYYASRPAIQHAEIVTLPYPLLLQKSAREALGISLKDHVVVIDEAHNLMNAVESIHSAQISGAQLQRAREGLIIYLQKFRNKLKGSNRTYVTQLVRVIDSLLGFTNEAQSQGGQGDQASQTALLGGKGVDQINLAKLVRYVNESKLARKVEGYIQHIREAQPAKKQNSASNESEQPAEVPTLMHLQSFLLCLMNPSKEGSLLWSKVDGQIVIQYLLLDPSEHFREVVEEARAVILAGGTMSPMDDYRQQLFPYLDSIVTFSCGHLIPPSSLFVRAVTADEQGRLDFSFKSRNESTATRLGMALASIAANVRGGMVVFFPSYTYLDTVIKLWRSTGVLSRLEASKPTFLDSRINNSAEEPFRSYSEAITTDTARGALLFSVIGGKLSEGINFSDDLGRCVVVIGLPFPNLETPEWKAKLRYLEAKAASRGEPQGKAGRDHAENLCMRSVNQAIGRAIRHKNDWASILLFDGRYAHERIQTKLPGWIKSSSNPKESGNVKDVVKDLGRFFEQKCGAT